VIGPLPEPTVLGPYWQPLGTFRVETDTLTVELSDAADGIVMADAVRVRQVTAAEIADGALVLSIGNAATIEGGDVVFTVTLSEPSDEPVTVRYQTGNATAANTPTLLDYEPGRGTITFEPGETVQQITVATVADARPEGVEHFYVLLSDAKGADIDAGLASGMIVDNDSVPLIDVGDATVTAGRDATFVVSLSNPYTETVTVDLATLDGTAQSGENFERKQETITFEPGETLVQVRIPTEHDAAIVEDNSKEFSVVLSRPGNATLDRVVGAGKITATPEALTAALIGPVEDPTGATAEGLVEDLIADPLLGGGGEVMMIVPPSDPPTVSISGDVYVTEGYDYEASFDVSLSSYFYEGVVCVEWETVQGSAKEYEDYSPNFSGWLYFNPGDTSMSITVDLEDDQMDEEDEVFSVRLKGATYYDTQQNATDLSISPDTANAYIYDNDTEPSVSVFDAWPREDYGDASFGLTLSNPSSKVVGVSWYTLGGTAQSGYDYGVSSPASGSVTFDIASAYAYVGIDVVNDPFDEPDEYFYFDIYSPINATLDYNNYSVYGTIEDNDDPPTVSIQSAEANEDTGNITFTLELSDESGYDVYVYYETGDAVPGGYQATADVDYVSDSDVVWFPQGSQTAEMSITLNLDQDDEPDEDFTA